MMRSMFSVVSGLKAYQTRMDVIGNNVANVNTVGFKSSRVTFKEVFSQTLKGSSAPDQTTGRGGTNPMQIGLGIGISSIDTIVSRGTSQRTDNPTDLSIEGEGFFILQEAMGAPFKFTRAGDFTIDQYGNFVNGVGMSVCGWQDYTTDERTGTYNFNITKRPEPLNFYSDEINKNKKLIAAKATSRVEFAGNLDAASEPLRVEDMNANNVHSIVPVTVYDSLGRECKVMVQFWRGESVEYGTGTPRNVATPWQWKVVSDPSNIIDLNIAGEGTILFGEKGNVLSNNPINPEDANYSLKPRITVTPNISSGTTPFEMELDFNKLDMFAAENSVKTTSRNGYPSGSLTTFQISQDGIIMGIYSNGQQKPLGMVALATFDNPAGLERAGGNLFVPTPNSGEFKKGIKPGAEGSGLLSPGTLEMSNVDLSKEFIDMMITQRGFQANSRIITTTDEMLQEMVNMKR